MGNIKVININKEDKSAHNGFFYVGRSDKYSSPLANPYTYNGKRSNIAKLSYKTREEALEAYKRYFNAMYGYDDEFTKAFDEIYELYKSGEDIYLGCFCAPKECHADYIAKKLQQKLIKENREKFLKEKANEK